MRLLDTLTLKLTEYQGEIPPYAIFSHRWLPNREGGEVLFEEMEGIRPRSENKASGYGKIQKVCGAAKADGFQHIWMDTCCIDKRSSAELQRAITSMFQYYRKAQRCYVYLHDVPSRQHPDAMAAFRKAEWFTRGWTLQELIAPSDLVFYADDWSRFGTKKELKDEIAKITGIDVAFLGGTALKNASVAQRLSWASNRNTTEEEDIAYCLVGLFEISIPVMYGEGRKKAFYRLQESVLKDTGDQSLFAWTHETPAEGAFGKQPFADSPRNFAGLGKVKAWSAPKSPQHAVQVVVVPSLKSYVLKNVSPYQNWQQSLTPLLTPHIIHIPPDTHVAGAVLRFGHVMGMLPDFLVVVGMSNSTTGWCNAIRDPGHEDLSKVLKSYTTKIEERDFDESDKLILGKRLFPLGIVDVKIAKPSPAESKFTLYVTVW